LVCAQMPEPFRGVGEFYDDFSQVSDEEVKDLLDRAARQSVVAAPDDREPMPRGAR
jgi:putative phosphoribosyl transferase